MKKRSFVMGRIFVALLAVVLIFVNVAALFLPRLDLSSESVLTLSEESGRYISSLSEDVEIYVIEGQSYDARFEIFLKEYARHSDRIKLEFISHGEAGELLALCGYSASDTFASYAVVVKSDKRARLIDYYSMFYYINPNFGQFTSSQYAEYYSMFSSHPDYAAYLSSLIYESEYYFYGDALLSGIVEYVTLDIIPKAYIVTSHGENSVSDGNFAKLLLAMEYDFGELALSDSVKVPRDAGCIIINEPTKDLSSAEAEDILGYLKSGGRLLLITDEAALDMPNLALVTSYYGVKASKGRVAQTIEGKESFSLVSSLNTDHDIIASMGKYSPKLVNANALLISDELRASQLVTPLVSSSESAYIEGASDVKKSFMLGVAVEEGVAQGTSRLVWFTGADSFNGELESADALALLLYSTAWLNKSYTTEIGTINAVPYSESVMQVPENAVTSCAVTVLVIVTAVITVGVVVINRRKKQ